MHSKVNYTGAELVCSPIDSDTMELDFLYILILHLSTKNAIDFGVVLLCKKMGTKKEHLEHINGCQKKVSAQCTSSGSV